MPFAPQVSGSNVSSFVADFESESISWVLSNSSITYHRTSEQNHTVGGGWSGKVTTTQSSNYGIEALALSSAQELGTYRVEGYLFVPEAEAAGFRDARLRVAWYQSQDGSGAQIEASDSDVADPELPDVWQSLSADLTAPPRAHSAKIRCLVRKASGTSSTTVYFDDIRIMEVDFSPSPTPAPTESPEPTDEPDPSAMPDPTDTPNPSASPRPSPSALPSPYPSPTPTLSPGPAPTLIPHVNLEVLPGWAARGSTPFAVYLQAGGLIPHQGYEYTARFHLGNSSYGSFAQEDGSFSTGYCLLGEADKDGNLSAWAFIKAGSAPTGSTFRVRLRPQGSSDSIVNDFDRPWLLDTNQSGWLEGHLFSDKVCTIPLGGVIVLAKDKEGDILGTYTTEDNTLDEGYPEEEGYFKLAVPAGWVDHLEILNENNELEVGYTEIKGPWWIIAGQASNTDKPEISPSPGPSGSPKPSRSPRPKPSPGSSPGPTGSPYPSPVRVKDSGLLISEVQTRGEGGGRDEFIELYNRTSQDISLEGCSLIYWPASGKHSSVKYSWSSPVMIPAYRHYLLTNADGYTGQTIEDAVYHQGIGDSGQLALFGSDRTLIYDSLSWGELTGENHGEGSAAESPSKGQSLERLPGNGDNIQDTNDNSADFFLQSDPNPQNLSSVAVEPQPQPAPSPYPLISVAQARSVPPEAIVAVKGSIIAPPGCLDEQAFFLEDETAGIRISSPESSLNLTEGSLVQVKGRLREEHHLLTIVPEKASDIQRLGFCLSSPLSLETGGLGEEHESRLVKINGKVTAGLRKTGEGLNFKIDDGSGQAFVQIVSRTGVILDSLKKGEVVEVVGLVGKRTGTSKGESLCLLPRRQSDLNKIAPPLIGVSDKTKTKNSGGKKGVELPAPAFMEESDSEDPPPPTPASPPFLTGYTKVPFPWWLNFAVVAIGLGGLAALAFARWAKREQGNG